MLIGYSPIFKMLFKIYLGSIFQDFMTVRLLTFVQDSFGLDWL